MSANRVAARYARALVEALAEKNALAETASFLEFCDMARDNAELRTLFANVTVGNADKAKVVNALAERLSLSDYVKRFLNILAQNGRLGILSNVKTAVSSALDKQSNIQSVHLTTATAPTDAQLTSFAESLGKRLGSQVRVDSSIDPDILGGAIAGVGSTVFDGSVRGQLQRLRRDLVKES